MKTFYLAVACVISWFVLVYPNGFCLVNINVQTGSQCSEADYSSVNEGTFQTNLRSLWDFLASNVVDHHGFYQTVVGNKANKVYGMILCRGDISADNCSNCTLNSIRAASNDCSNSIDVSVWFTWCFLRYSNESFFGAMQQTAVAITNDTDFDDPSVVSEGLPFMNGLAATAAEQPFMFQTAILNVSRWEEAWHDSVHKRYQQHGQQNVLGWSIGQFQNLFLETKKDEKFMDPIVSCGTMTITYILMSQLF